MKAIKGLNLMLNCVKISRGFISYNKNFHNLNQYLNPNLYMMNLLTKQTFENDQVNVQNNFPVSVEEDNITTEMKGRNSKAPKRANHGARPCSSVMRRLKARAYHKHQRVK
jgi:hypothetical protein